MKTTIDLPQDVVRQLKMRAVLDGRTVKELAGELLRNGLKAPVAKSAARPVIGRDKKTGFPVILGGRRAPKGDPTPEEIAEILLDQEIDRAHGIG
jgi:hypothetical protein